ncbi:hypothetical protein BCR34DRAFT_566803 [Clohesyomyces aquaticus]|uniref:Uncharacterized protein n=1 Tax=Clohesyomyces aquaticus TaxID=1231657 RepID=A0A1Y1ZJF5_9PLEO|nr:hypothetical protein BCR34DRAFT_566803 [Clohesyomyces aquaticus]
MNEFQQAHAEFLDKLTDEEKGSFLQVKTSKELLEGLQKFSQFSKNKTKWTNLCNRVRGCSDKLNPYFSVISITVQSHPEWAAIAWGAFRLVLLLASNYGTFFDKLGDLLEQLSAKIPAYDSISETKSIIQETFNEALKKAELSSRLPPTVEISDRFQNSLRAFYLDLFEIFQSIARVFTSKSGKLKKTPVVISQLIWQPFDVRYANLLQRLDRHNEILKLELKIMTFKMESHIARILVDATTQKAVEMREIFPSLSKIQSQIKDFESRLLSNLTDHSTIVHRMREAIDTADKRSLLGRIQSWIGSSPFMDTFERLISARQEGTAEWIFQTDIYRNWEEKSIRTDNNLLMGNFLWVQGIPGVGKSVLSASVIQSLRGDVELFTSSHPLVTFFIFEYNARDGRPAPRHHAYRAIMAQLLERLRDNDDVLELFSFAMTRRRHGQTTATTSELVDLIRMLASRIDRWYIVIDGVDECEEADDLILDLGKALGDQQTKLVLFSRPNVRSLRHQMKPEQILSVTRLLNEDDLRLYFNTHLERFQNLGILSASASRDHLVSCLITGANGMFQWARLMINHLRSDGLVPWQRLNIIRRLKTPERLEEMYIRILRHLVDKLSSEQSMARRIFLWLTFGKRSLSTKELEDVLVPCRESSSDLVEKIDFPSEEERFCDFEHSVVMVSGSLVEKRWCSHTQATIYSFIHGSVMEFFQSKCKAAESCFRNKAGTIEYFLPPVREAECDLTLDCLSYIFNRVPGKPLSGSIFEAASPTTLTERQPFVSYAALQWPYHLASMGKALAAQQLPNPNGFQHSAEEIFTKLGRFLLTKLLPMVWVELTYTFEKEPNSHNTLHKTLLDWAEQTEALNIPNLPDDAGEVPAAIAAFAEDLATLHALWGDTLLLSPHQIWQDVTAFTQSPFFVTTSAVSLKTLTAESLGRSAAGTFPLSKISRDDPSTDLLAVLTIWPSKAFTDTLDTLDGAVPRRKRPRKVSRYDGWVAQCELWDIDADEPVLVEDSRVSLDKEEIEVQYERFRKHIKNFDKSLTAKAARKELALHFPSSIESDLRTISVLRTIFRRRLPFPKSLAGASKPLADIWRPILMPIRHTLHATLLLGFPPATDANKQARVAESPGSIPRALRLGRTPAFRILTHGNFVLYQSVEGRDGLSEEEDPAGTIAAYKITHQDGADNIRLLGCIEGDGSRGCIVRCCFHPQLPLLAFHYVSRTGISQLFLWSFTKHSSDDNENFVLLNHELLQPGMTGGFSLASIASIQGRLKYLHFTSCGTSLIYQPYHSTNPHIRNITESVLYKSAVQASECDDVRNQPFSHDMQDRSSALVKTNELPKAMVLDRPAMHADGSFTTLSFNPSAAHRDVKLVHSEGNVEEEQSLLSLPSWEDIKNVSVSMRMPDAKRDDKVTFITNKTAQPFYFLGDGGKHTSPTVVRKNIRAIRKVEKRALSNGWHGVSYEGMPHEEDEGGQNIQKRLRLGNQETS